MASGGLNFDGLVAAIEQAHAALAEQASRAVNVSLTLRNWMIGCHIVEFEQAGTDRAAYGGRLLDSLAPRLQGGGLRRVEARELRRFRQFYLAYPQIRETLPPELAAPAATLIRETASAESTRSLVPARQMLDKTALPGTAARQGADGSLPAAGDPRAGRAVMTPAAPLAEDWTR